MTQLGLPKWAKRVWPYEMGMQTGFWEREEEFANVHANTNTRVAVVRKQTLETIREILSHASHSIAHPRIQIIMDSYDIALNEVYTAHRKAITDIKARYPEVR